jgi:hypothetical protein
MRRALLLALFLFAADARGEELLEHADDVVDYTMKASLDPATHVVHGEGTIVWRNKSAASVKELWFHLYLNAFKNEKSVFLSEPVGQFRGGGLPKDWGFIDVKKLMMGQDDLWKGVELSRPNSADQTDACVPLPKDIAPGESITLEIAFESKLPTVVERTGYDGSFHMIAQWFPKIARLEPDGTWAHFPFHHLAEFYSDFGTYDVTLDVPQNFTIGATGAATEKKLENGRRIERHVQGDIHDFAWTAWDKFESRSEKIGTVDVTVLYPSGYKVDAERELATMRFALPHYGEKYGAYPYPVLTMMHPPMSAPEAGGMEYPTLITTGGPWYGPPGVMFVEEVTIHEFGHQFFYGLIATDEVTWPFLDEGLNSFAEDEGMTAWRGEGSAIDLFGLRVSNTTIQSMFSRKTAHNEPVAQPAWAFVSGRDYGRLVYGRTATILETLRRVYGDERMMRAFGNYTRRHRFRHPAPDDLFVAFEDELGPEARQFLHTAFFERGWIDFAVDDVATRPVHDPAGIFDGKTVPPDTNLTGEHEGFVTVMRRGTIVLPVKVDLVAADGTRTRVTWDGHGDSVRLPYRGKSPLAFALVDPDHEVLLDDEPSNNWGASTAASRSSTRRALERTTYWSELVASFLFP